MSDKELIRAMNELARADRRRVRASVIRRVIEYKYSVLFDGKTDMTTEPNYPVAIFCGVNQGVEI